MPSFWANDSIQFPRLISEIEEAGGFTTKLVSDLALSMELEISDIMDLLQRAHVAWNTNKEAI